MKKSIPKFRERESKAFILGNDREREFPLTPVAKNIINYQGVNKMMDVALVKAVQAKEAG